MLGGPPCPMRTGALGKYLSFINELALPSTRHQPRQHRQAKPIINTRARPHVRVLSFVIVNRYG